MKKILFVDDDPNLLRGIRRGLHALRPDWEMFFAANGREALELLAETSVDVVVSDFQMPGMNGLELLSQVEFDHPDIIRVMLTGKPDRVTYAQTVNIGHYFFWKPLTLEAFKRFLGRLASLDTILADQFLRQRLNALTSLPIHPASYARLTSYLDDLNSSPRQLAYIAGKDIALAMQLFKLTSSASFALETGIETLEEAVAYLDVDTIRSLLTAHHVLTSGNREVCQEFKLDQLQQHSFRVARLAEALILETEDDPKLVSDVVLGGLLHNVGLLVLAHCMPEQYRQAMAISVQEKVSVKQAEQRIFNTNHAAVGGYLAALWGVPDAVVESICQHNQTRPPTGLDVSPITQAVWHANRICQGDISFSQEQYRLLHKNKKLAGFLESVCPPVSG
ncbi:MAG: HDOD domain-containing protein [Thermodesulfobacteriota bacterium]|nr:HDOD domain-containing protein [Thermodesulfobacteriota bacterium]